MNSQVLSVFDELLRSPRAVAERSRAGGDLRPLFVASLAALVFGAGVFGATLATSRGGLQLLYSGVKLPLAMVATMLLVVPAFHAIATGLGRPLGFSGMIGLTLAAAGRGALVLVALSPVTWLCFDRGLSYHPGVLLAVACYGLAGLAALDLVLRGVGFDARGFAIVSLFSAVLFATGGQTAWMLRPFLGRPAAASVPFFRHRESSFWDAVQQSSLSSFGVYRVSQVLSETEEAIREKPGPRLEVGNESR
ncbi:MAG TPA: hypothetical protein VFK05_22680 [Polyangiaceae bacterium]|nr:hypothetical protein [Polyangiaceae bacterium]